MIAEPEELREFSPLDEPVNEKRYTNAAVNTSGFDFSKPLDEPSFKPPPFNAKEQEAKKAEPFNPELKNLSKKDTEMAASHMVKMVLAGYEYLHVLANKSLQISEKRLSKMQADGELNLNAMIDYDYGKKIRAGEFFKEYNNQTKDALEVTDEFKEEITPVLERIFAKRGIGMTDEQLAMFIIGKDVVGKSIIWFQMKQQTNFILKNIAEASLAANIASTPPPQPATQPKQEQEEEIKGQEPEEVAVDEYKAEVVSENKTKKRGRKPKNG
jgi:hypothetical protein